MCVWKDQIVFGLTEAESIPAVYSENDQHETKIRWFIGCREGVVSPMVTLPSGFIFIGVRALSDSS
jgi:hypothetical protein